MADTHGPTRRRPALPGGGASRRFGALLAAALAVSMVVGISLGTVNLGPAGAGSGGPV